MMRVNLLPPEILQRRQAEKRIGWVAVGALVIAVVFAMVWGLAQFQLQSKEGELASIEQQVQAVQTQADQLAIFEIRADELGLRRATAQRALGGRIGWARIFDEISLVLPSDMWVQSMVASEEDGFALSGYTLDSPSDAPDVGHKVIAKALVRLAELESIYDVWLSSSVKDEYEDQPAIQYMITTKVKPPSAEGGPQ